MADDDLSRLAREFRVAGALAPDRMHDIIKRAGQNIKDDWQDMLRRRQKHGHIPHLIRSVGYDVDRTPYGASVVVGFDKMAKQGPLGTFLEFGSVNNPPGYEGARALQKEAAKAFGAVAKAEGGFL